MKRKIVLLKKIKNSEVVVFVILKNLTFKTSLRGSVRREE